MPHTLVLMRHGESAWNLENRFTGWVDVDLTKGGSDSAFAAGTLLKSKGFSFDIAYTSVLKRAVRTLWLTLDAMDQMWLPVVKHWRLNERHYGALQGLNKAETVKEYGEAQVLLWRRSYDTPPPPLNTPQDFPRGAYPGLSEVPRAECLKDTVDRVLPYWEGEIAPAIRAGKRVLISAHGNSLRALVKHLDKVSDEDIVGLNIPNAVPLIYEFDADLKPLRSYYL